MAKFIGSSFSIMVIGNTAFENNNTHTRRNLDSRWYVCNNDTTECISKASHTFLMTGRYLFFTLHCCIYLIWYLMS